MNKIWETTAELCWSKYLGVTIVMNSELIGKTWKSTKFRTNFIWVE